MMIYIATALDQRKLYMWNIIEQTMVPKYGMIYLMILKNQIRILYLKEK